MSGKCQDLRQMKLDSCSALQWLTQGGDERIRLDENGLNAYGLPQIAPAHWLGLGSSTATPLSSRGLAALSQLYERLQAQLQNADASVAAAIYAEEMQGLREQLIALYGLNVVSGGAVVFASSGTQVHRLVAARLAAQAEALGKKFTVIMMAASETGSQVPAVLRAAGADNVHSMALRTADAKPRSADALSAEVEAQIAMACAQGGRALLIAVDVSKSGLLAPSVECLLALKQRWPGQLEIMIDACQGRLAPTTIQAWLQADCLLALTGSKFIAGPAFSGLLLLPPRLAAVWVQEPVPAMLNNHSLPGDWPANWNVSGLVQAANFGLLLRWQAAVAELQCFLALPEARVMTLLQRFATQVQHTLASLPMFAALDLPRLERQALRLGEHWDDVPSVFPFLLRSRASYLPAATLHHLQRQLLQAPEQIYQFGQPVLCACSERQEIAALRLCASARLVVNMAASESAAQKVLQQLDEALQELAKRVIEIRP